VKNDLLSRKKISCVNIKLFFGYAAMKTFSKLFIILFTLSLASGCAYYNTFFNAKKYFNDAEKERSKRLDREKKQLQQQGAGQTHTVERLSSNEIKNYNESIKKASKVLEVYPNSSYIDDALFLLGKSFFRLRDFQKAERKFIELIENFPQSKFAAESKLWLGKTYIEMQDYETAENTFQNILNSDVKQIIVDETRYLLGGLFKHKKDYMRAVSEFESAAKRARDKAIRAQSYFEMGECYFQLKNYNKAINSFLNARKFSPDDKTEFNAMFQAGLTYMQIQNYDEAIKLFIKLLGDAVNEENWPTCRLEVAHCHRHSGNYDTAIEWYLDVIERHPKTVEAANAYYYLGKIYLEQKAEYELAKEYFDKSPAENARALKANDARTMSNSIQRLLALHEDIIQQKKRIAAGDSVAAVMQDSVEVSPADLDTFRISFIDSMFADTTNFDMDSLGIFDDTLRVQLMDSIRYAFENDDDLELRKRVLTNIEIARRRSQFRAPYSYQQQQELERQQQQTQSRLAIKTGQLGTPQEELVKDRLLLAEIYLFEFNQPDSALQEFLKILEIDTSRKVIPKVLYSIGFIAENFKQDIVLADSMFKKLVQEFPDDPFSQHARKQVKTIEIPDPELVIAEQFRQAERAYFDRQDYSHALNEFSTIVDKYPSSEFAAKSLLAMGWIYENRLEQTNQAITTYQTLLEKFPNSQYAKSVQKKINEVEKANSATSASDLKIADEKIKTEQEKPEDRSDDQQTGEIDSTPMTNEQYISQLRSEMQKNDPRRKTARRW